MKEHPCHSYARVESVTQQNEYLLALSQSLVSPICFRLSVKIFILTWEGQGKNMKCTTRVHTLWICVYLYLFHNVATNSNSKIFSLLHLQSISIAKRSEVACENACFSYCAKPRKNGGQA